METGNVPSVPRGKAAPAAVSGPTAGSASGAEKSRSSANQTAVSQAAALRPVKIVPAGEGRFQVTRPDGETLTVTAPGELENLAREAAALAMADRAKAPGGHPLRMVPPAKSESEKRGPRYS